MYFQFKPSLDETEQLSLVQVMAEKGGTLDVGQVSFLLHLHMLPWTGNISIFCISRLKDPKKIIKAESL